MVYQPSTICLFPSSPSRWILLFTIVFERVDLKCVLISFIIDLQGSDSRVMYNGVNRPYLFGISNFRFINIAASKRQSVWVLCSVFDRKS
uniref:Uncharacterized protein n=1 Tax=Lepeophtheirus salmonis TaxID=72036 RepID=A0A0K2U7N3_LEPSM